MSIQLDLEVIGSESEQLRDDKGRLPFKNKFESLCSKEIFVIALVSIAAFFHPISSAVGLGFFVAAAFAGLNNYVDDVKQMFFTPWALFAAALFLMIIVGCFYSPATLTHSMSFVIKYLGLALLPLFAVVFRSKSSRFWATHAFLFAMLFSFSCSLIMYYGYSGTFGSHKEVGAVFGNHVFVSYEMSFACFISAIYAIRTQGITRIFYLALLIIFSYHVLFMNNGRTGYFTYGLFAVICLIYFAKNLNYKIIGIILATLLLGVSQSPVVKVRVGELIGDIKSYQQENSVGFRIRFHHYAESLFFKNPLLGAGTGAFEYYFSHDRPEPGWFGKLNHPHGEYWHMAAEHGTIGLVLFISFLLALVYRAFHTQSMKIIFLGLLISYGFCFTFDAFLLRTTPQVLFMLFTAMGLGESYELSKKLDVSKSAS